MRRAAILNPTRKAAAADPPCRPTEIKTHHNRAGGACSCSCILQSKSGESKPLSHAQPTRQSRTARDALQSGSACGCLLIMGRRRWTTQLASQVAPRRVKLHPATRCVTHTALHLPIQAKHAIRQGQANRSLKSNVTRHTSNVTRHTSHVTPHTSHVTRHTSHVTRHTLHVTRHTSHVTCPGCGRYRGASRAAENRRRERRRG
jgi:hypothetical protein